MTVTEKEIDTLVDYCTEHLGDKSLWTTPAGYPHSLALCIIDAIYSTGSHYTSVVNVINRYRSVRGDTDGANALLESIHEAGGPAQWATDVAGNIKPANTRPGAPLKADVIQQAAQLLTGLGIDTVDDLIANVSPRAQNSPVHAAWKKLPSQSSGVTFNYLLILAGLPSVKPDRMVLRFLGDAFEESNVFTPERAVALVEATAAKLDVSARVLDHILWRAASGRELTD